jgi:FMN phosphatase YigB (HAD superfamily)
MLQELLKAAPLTFGQALDMRPSFVYFDLCNVLVFMGRDRPAWQPTSSTEPISLNVGMLPVVAALERVRVPIGILSNLSAAPWQHIVERDWGILPGRFQEIVLSCEVGISKPEPAFFAEAAARAGVDPAQIYYCDDTPAHVAAARAVGWDAEVFTSAVAVADSLGRRGLNLGL